MKLKPMAAALAAALSLTLAAVPAFAENEATPTVEEIPAAEESYTDLDTEPSSALTPDGNLTLVDDYTTEDGSKQFITVVTKSGNYFYLIIDRDDSGDSTVHFLNLVDEYDLLALLDEDDVSAYEAEQEAVVEAETPVETPAESAPMTADELISDSVQDSASSSTLLPVLGLGALALAGGGIYGVQLLRKRRSSEQPAADPDDEYEADDLIVLPTEGAEERKDV